MLAAVDEETLAVLIVFAAVLFPDSSSFQVQVSRGWKANSRAANHMSLIETQLVASVAWRGVAWRSSSQAHPRGVWPEAVPCRLVRKSVRKEWQREKTGLHHLLEMS